MSAQECGALFADPMGNACRCTREPHPGMAGHRGVVIGEASSSIRDTVCVCGHALAEHKGLGACRHDWAGLVPVKTGDPCHCTRFVRLR